MRRFSLLVAAGAVAASALFAAPSSAAELEATPVDVHVSAVTPRQPASQCFTLGQRYGTGCYASTRRAGSPCWESDHMWFAKTAYSGRKARTVVCDWRNVVQGGRWVAVPGWM
jgi:hypothetical protein